MPGIPVIFVLDNEAQGMAAGTATSKETEVK